MEAGLSSEHCCVFLLDSGRSWRVSENDDCDNALLMGTGLGSEALLCFSDFGRYLDVIVGAFFFAKTVSKGLKVDLALMKMHSACGTLLTEEKSL